MPTYTYRRSDGTTFDIEQRITESALTTCPTTGQAVTRVITGGSGLVFKGSGFYLTDYARKGNSTSESSVAAPAGGGAKTETAGSASPSGKSAAGSGGTSTAGTD